MAMRMRTGVTACALAAFVAAGGCNSTGGAKVSPGASPDRDERMLGALKQLEGEWEMADENGQAQLACVYKVSSAGSVVREIMFPGHPHEMTNLYHMDGGKLVVTHYCAAGNFPRMAASGVERSAEGDVLDFRFDGVSNLREEHEGYMGGLTLTIHDANHIRQDWTHFDREGVAAGEKAVFDLHRRASH